MAEASMRDRSGTYIASRASIPGRAAEWRRLRDEEGHHIVSSWIDEDATGQLDFSELWMRVEREIAGAQRLVLYAEPGDFPLKGALTEVGLAIANQIPVIVVAPGVELEPRSHRPLGSWVAHPLVSFADTMAEALASPDDPAAARAASPADGVVDEGRSILEEMTALFEKTDEANIPGTDSYTILWQAREFLRTEYPVALQPAQGGSVSERLRQMDAALAEGFIECPRCGEEITTSDMDVRSDIRDALSAARASAPAAPEVGDPLDTPLPCAVSLPGVRFSKGVKLRTLVDAASRWKVIAAKVPLKDMEPALEEARESGFLTDMPPAALRSAGEAANG